MNRTSVNRNLLILLGMILLCAGCRHDAGLEGLVPVEGIVTLNDEPVENAFLLFRPIGQGQAASATTNTDGRFSLMTFQPGDGARSGEYLVTVTKKETRGEIRIERPDGTNQKIVHDNREIVNHLPEKYAAPCSADLKITIPETGDAELEFALTGEADTTPKKVKDMKRRM